MAVGEDYKPTEPTVEFAQPENNESSAVADLPSGVHPMDPSEEVHAEWDNNAPVPKDQGGSRYKQGAKGFAVDPEDALAVFQRSSQGWTANNATITQAVQAVGRQRGRVSVSIWVPSTATYGVQIAPSAGEVEATTGEVQLAPGDSVTIPTEAPVWVAPIPGNANGTYNVLVTFNPAGGVLGSL